MTHNYAPFEAQMSKQHLLNCIRDVLQTLFCLKKKKILKHNYPKQRLWLIAAAAAKSYV
jgi:hypothetical protein